MKFHKEGHVIIRNTLVGAAIIMAAWTVLSISFNFPIWALWSVNGLALICVPFVMMFFREPIRERICDDNIVYAPADGTVVVIEGVQEKEFFGERRMQVSIFMSVTNVHINWYPVAGKLVYHCYHPGEFMVASHPKSSDDNEHMSVAIDTGREVVMYRQIAGLIARRIVSYAERVGQQVEQNVQCGFIKFGSRVDLFLPLDCEILVGLGEKTVGSQTPIARLKR